MNATPSPPITDVPERIAQLIWTLCQTVTERCGLRARTLTAAQVEYIVARLLAARKRFRRVVERIRAGNPPKARARQPKPRPVRPKPEPPTPPDMDTGFKPPKGWRRWAREDRARARQAAREQAALARAVAAEKPLPLWRTLRQHLPGWLCGCAPTIAEFPRSAASHALALRGLLAEPEMQALLMSHRAVGDSLRKLCWGLGVDVSLLYPAPSDAPAARTTAETVAATPPPDDGTTQSVALDEKRNPGSATAPSPPAADGAVPPARANGALFATV